ncbi:MAG: TIGR00282 family metallophosphoesterase [Candidatus Omnitrophota bacterium]|nr:TIGR00282 family metallophosphoesterase [Candidatus Omnitrophota bacterium]
MKVLMIGDIVGSPGRQAIKTLLGKLKTVHKPELVVANGENAAGGSGLTPAMVKELLSFGIDVITSGDHIWKKKEVLDIIDIENRLLRPANYPFGVPGKGSLVIEGKSGIKIGVINLLGRVFMMPMDCPFKSVREEIDRIKKETRVIVVDIHAEATSEKIAMGWYLDGLVSAVAGTHTHVQTSDEKILPNKTAYISDIGMTGPINSVLGRRKEQVLERFITCMPVRFQMADENIQLQGVVIDIDPRTGRASFIERIIEKL